MQTQSPLTVFDQNGAKQGMLQMKSRRVFPEWVSVEPRLPSLVSWYLSQRRRVLRDIEEELSNKIIPGVETDNSTPQLKDLAFGFRG